MKFAVCNEIFAPASWPETCRIAKDAGFTGVEIAPWTFADHVGKITSAQRTEIATVAKDHGLTIAALHMILFSPKGLRINGADAAARATAADYLRQILDFAGDLGCQLAIYGSPPTRIAEPPAVPYAQARTWFKEAILAAMPTAQARGVTLCIEPLPADCTNLCTTVEGAYGLVQEVNHPNFGLMADTKAMSTELRPVDQTIRLFGPYLKHLHVNDATGKAPGFGTLDFAPIIKAVKESGYQGWVSYEPFDYNKPDPQSLVLVSLKYLKSLV